MELRVSTGNLVGAASQPYLQGPTLFSIVMLRGSPGLVETAENQSAGPQPGPGYAHHMNYNRSCKVIILLQCYYSSLYNDPITEVHKSRKRRVHTHTPHSGGDFRHNKEIPFGGETHPQFPNSQLSAVRRLQIWAWPFKR